MNDQLNEQLLQKELEQGLISSELDEYKEKQTKLSKEYDELSFKNKESASLNETQAT